MFYIDFTLLKETYLSGNSALTGTNIKKINSNVFLGLEI